MNVIAKWIWHILQTKHHEIWDRNWLKDLCGVCAFMWHIQWDLRHNSCYRDGAHSIKCTWCMCMCVCLCVPHNIKWMSRTYGLCVHIRVSHTYRTLNANALTFSHTAHVPRTILHNLQKHTSIRRTETEAEKRRPNEISVWFFFRCVNVIYICYACKLYLVTSHFCKHTQFTALI